MKYFLDTEFLEGTQRKMFGETKPTIDLISVGIVCEDGREYYAISKDFNLKEAWNRWQQRTGEGDRNNIEPKEYWIRENVLKPIFDEWNKYSYHSFTYKSMKYCLKMIGKSNKQIAKEIQHFVTNRPINANKEQWILDYDTRDVKFYGYYSAYDWVVFCWLFGKMIDLPKGFPMYCIDLKQMMDEVIKKPVIGGTIFGYRNITDLKNNSNYPRQTNEHSAIHDARWNKQLYEFLNKL